MSRSNWRLARSLVQLRNQVDAKFPNRSRAIDGTIGDLRHQTQNPSSSHNPDRFGVVRAWDLTHDPRTGVHTYHFAEHLRLMRDRRLHHVISERRIFSPTNTPWTWRPYSGTPHNGHAHIAVSDDPNVYDLQTIWSIDFGPPGFRDGDAQRATLRLGARGDDVRTLQRLLSPFEAAEQRVLVVDGIFGPRTDTAVRRFQEVEGLLVDGIVGPRTWERLGLLEAE